MGYASSAFNGHIVLSRTKNIEWHYGTNGRRQYIEGTAGNHLGIFASSGVGIGTNNPTQAFVHINGDVDNGNTRIGNYFISVGGSGFSSNASWALSLIHI